VVTKSVQTSMINKRCITGPNFIINDLPSVLILIITDQILTDSLLF